MIDEIHHFLKDVYYTNDVFHNIVGPITLSVTVLVCTMFYFYCLVYYAKRGEFQKKIDDRDPLWFFQRKLENVFQIGLLAAVCCVAIYAFGPFIPLALIYYVPFLIAKHISRKYVVMQILKGEKSE